MKSVNSRLSIAMHCLVFIHEYGGEKKVTSALLALSTGCNPVVIRNILSALKKAGLITVPQGTGGAKLALSPREIRLSAVYYAVNQTKTPAIFGFHPNPASLCPVGRNIHSLLETPYQALGSMVFEQMKTMSLQDILDDYHKIPEDAR